MNFIALKKSKQNNLSGTEPWLFGFCGAMEVRTARVTAGWGCVQWSAETAALWTSPRRCTPQQHQQPGACFRWVGSRQGTACPTQGDIGKEKVPQDFICPLPGPATVFGYLTPLLYLRVGLGHFYLFSNIQNWYVYSSLLYWFSLWLNISLDFHFLFTQKWDMG